MLRFYFCCYNIKLVQTPQVCTMCYPILHNTCYLYYTSSYCNSINNIPSFGVSRLWQGARRHVAVSRLIWHAGQYPYGKLACVQNEETSPSYASDG